MIIRPLVDDFLYEREDLARRVDALKSAGICPSCRDFDTGDIYPPADGRIICESDEFLCLLEQYPRNPGHTIILVKQHFEDVSEMPPLLGADVFTLIHTVIAALKQILAAEKIYLCTMCDGARNHLHFQLIPRLPGDEIQGSKLFVKKRGVLDEYADVVGQLRTVLASTW